MNTACTFSKSMLFSVLLCIFTFATAFGGSSDNDPYQTARKALERARETIGSLDMLHGAGGLTVEYTGQFRLDTRLQGIGVDAPEATPLTERVAWRSSDGATYFESRRGINADAEEWMRYVYLAEGALLGVVRPDLFSFVDTGPHVRTNRLALQRTIPQFLIDEALRSPLTLHFGAHELWHGEPVLRLHYTTTESRALTLYVDRNDYPAGVSYMADVPMRGDTRVSWRYSMWEKLPGGGAFPGLVEVFLNGRLLRAMHVSRVVTGTPEEGLFTVPEGMEMPDIPEQSAEQPSEGGPETRVVEVAENVYACLNVRSGFHMLFVVFNDYVVAVDAPAGWQEFHTIPETDFTPGETSSSVSERYIEAIRETVPDKPIRYVVLTHFHDDHAGGVRAFVAAGAVVLATPQTERIVREALARPHSIGNDPLSEKEINPVIETVNSGHVLSDGTMRMELLYADGNPHVEQLLVAWLPEQGILYTADLFEPAGMAFFPNPRRVPVMRYFVDWLDEQAFSPERIYSVHGGFRVTEEHLDAIRELSVDK